MKLDLLVLDWSGVVSHDLPLVLESVAHICRHFGKQPVSEADFRASFQPSLRDIYAKWGIHDYETVARMHRDFFATAEQKPTAIPGAVAAVKELSGYVPIAIFSSHPTDALLGDIWRYGLQENVKLAFGSVEKGATRDFEQLLEAAQVSPDGVIYAGDTTIDMHLARIAGVRSAAIVHEHYGYQPKAQVASFEPKPTYGIMEHVGDLVKLVKNGF
jgi:phosphoglycolate phosphatase-like HAD superfamily hydrolase